MTDPRLVLAAAEQDLQALPDHGQRSRYQQGCRCLLCRASNAVYQAQLRKRQAQGLPILGQLVSAKDAGAKVRRILVEGYTRQQISQQSRLERHTLPKLNAAHRCRLQTLLRIRRTARILLAEETFPDTDAQA